MGRVTEARRACPRPGGRPQRWAATPFRRREGGRRRQRGLTSPGPGQRAGDPTRRVDARPLHTAPYSPGWRMEPRCSPRAPHPRPRAPQPADGTRFHRPHHVGTIRSYHRRKEAERKRKGAGLTSKLPPGGGGRGQWPRGVGALAPPLTPAGSTLVPSPALRSRSRAPAIARVGFTS